MASGVLIFKGMKTGILPGDISFEHSNSHNLPHDIILSTAYNVLPIWVRIAHDNLRQSKQASETLRKQWSENPEYQKELLILELEPSLQVFVASGIALDALYDQLKPYAKLGKSEIEKWRSNRTGRAKQISEVIRRVYNLKPSVFKEFKEAITKIIKYRDLAVHPSLELKQSCSRPDINVGVDWKFSAYKFANSEWCFQSLIRILGYIYDRKSKVEQVNEQMKNVILALEELKVIKVMPQKTNGNNQKHETT